MDETQIAALVRLEAISVILGIPIDHFMHQSVPCDILVDDEFLRLWSQLKTAKGRRLALDALRRVVDEETA